MAVDLTGRGPTDRRLDRVARTWLPRCLPGIVAISALLVLPAGSDAKAGYEVHPGGIELILPVKKTVGYVISVSANERRRVQFALDRSSSGTEYTTTGHVSSDRIEAAFGALGQIDVRLHLRRHRPDPPHSGRCKGRAPLYQEGSYHGVIEFSRQSDVPKVSVTSGKVYFERRFRQVCKRRHSQSILGGKDSVEAAVLTVAGNDQGQSILLQALNFASKRNPSHSWGQFAVAVYEKHEGVQIVRKMNVPFSGSSFVISARGRTPEIVELEPPEPFTGSALYSRSLNSLPSWTGDLSISLPGRDSIPLTGSGFSALLCRSRSVTAFTRCLSSGSG